MELINRTHQWSSASTDPRSPYWASIHALLVLGKPAARRRSPPQSLYTKLHLSAAAFSSHLPKLFSLHASRQWKVAFMQMQARFMYSHCLSDGMPCVFIYMYMTVSHNHAHCGPRLGHPPFRAWGQVDPEEPRPPSSSALAAIRPEVIANSGPFGLRHWNCSPSPRWPSWAGRLDSNSTPIDNPEAWTALESGALITTVRPSRFRCSLPE